MASITDTYSQLRFQVQLKEKYLPNGSTQCPLCEYSSPVNKLIFKHVAVTHQKLKEFISEEQAASLFNKIKVDATATTKIKPKPGASFFHEEPFPATAAEFKKQKFSAPMGGGAPSNLEVGLKKFCTVRHSSLG